MDLSNLTIPKINEDRIFENLTKDLFCENVLYENVNLNGRPGQRQFGVDVFAKLKDDGSWIGVQCKVRGNNKSFTKKEIYIEINKARNFNPSITKFHLFTTLSRDAITQEIAREISDELKIAKSFEFEILYWDDIVDKLKNHENLFHRYFHKLTKDNLNLGHLIGKLLNLELQFDDKDDTHLELMIGFIPQYKDTSGHQVDYYRNLYFIVNLHDKKLEFFQKDKGSQRPACHVSDIEQAFSNFIDRYRVCKWLNTIEHIDDFIYNDEKKYKFSISSSERRLLDNRTEMEI